ncbi:inositol monophosphatase family protein [Bartonella ancashensis]|uniref:Inositol-1-monophosphatase n=1 Tax=Bartonella ancashensis TaxID=1318743 RepID=A0A0M4LHR6_9HYPH|nr:inositol monophosphatase family protein [Bartonella ancashensis]ALE03118.1 Inositol-1-monophosphatase [Bartonella ancashensis]
MARSALMNVMVQAALKAGRSLIRDYGEVQNLQVSLKGPADYVSQASHKAERTLLTELMKARPKFSFSTEHSEEIIGEDAQHRFVIEPLGGTTNFSHGIPFFAVSIALERQGQFVAAVIYNPILDELFTAERGHGAFFNDRRCRVAGRKKLVSCVIGTGMPRLGKVYNGSFSSIHAVTVEAAGVRCFGAASLNLAYVAIGRLDGFWDDALSMWNVAAGTVLMREAGGFVNIQADEKNPSHVKNIVSGNEIICSELEKTLAKSALRKS